MLIFVLQAIWLYIKELAGKDLDIATVLKFLFYITPTLIPLILPLTILLSSIMVFGSFAENYEFAAMKSTGISLQRAMKSLSIFIGLLALTTFFFSNNVIPWAEYESYNLRKNIAKLKPAMAIAEGQFNNIGEDLIIKVEEKYGDNGKFLKNVIIHQKVKNRSSLHKTTIAKTGELLSSQDSNILELVLYDGYYYDDTPPKGVKERKRHPFTKTYFKKYVTNFDLSGLNKVDLDDKQTSDKYSMLDILDLNYAIDSLKKVRVKGYEDYSATLLKRTNIDNLNKGVEIKQDSTQTNDITEHPKDILSLFEPKRQIQVIDYALNTLTSTKQIIESRKASTSSEDTWLNKHAIALHKKFALAAACIILFFIGAPLGALIRKGGMGLPMVIAIVLFLTYHFIGLFAENSAKSNSLNPVLAAYFSSLIMLPLSIFLTKRATEDRGIFEFDHIIVPLKKKLRITKSKQKNSKNLSESFNADITNKATIIYQNLNNTLKITLSAFICLAAFVILHFVFKNNKLPELSISVLYLAGFGVIIYLVYFIKSVILKNTFNTTITLNKVNLVNGIISFICFPLGYFNLKSTPYNITATSNTKVKVNSSLEANDYNAIKASNETQNILKKYVNTSKISLITNIAAILLFVAYFILKNNKQESLAISSLQLSLISFCIFVVYFIKSERFIGNYKTSLQIKSQPIYLKLIGFILYPILYFKNKKSIA